MKSGDTFLFKMKKAQKKPIETTESSSMLYMQHSQVMVVYTEKSDREVWNSFKAGDEAAFNYIYRKHVADLYNYGMQICRQDELTRDCLQKMFVDLRKNQAKLGDVQRIKGYLFTVFQRELFKLLKKEKKQNAEWIAIDAEEDAFFIESSHETKLIAEEFADEKKEEISKALNKLSPKQRQAIILLYQEELSYKEIADIMNFKEVKTARTLVYRAMEKLKEIFEVKKA
ncbi:RNA polymerase sigma factor [Algoriphagus halophytocola]|uniref:RNA polymerase sigma factor n=1 Tax=Algoriphagus halophytocola TaxID=2991499 RepID=A0ABY6MKP8_9BACT|nr:MULTISPECIES: RNA polymerase sigma factor [unclassified Algoriphagus]UZD22856.1 RNA polymerase sigma factor [Algoriphagus sp. TR-M5]WBL44123.1 RNA polymerase sigma factor [Algoriphagus sp. TR-M9]